MLTTEPLFKKNFGQYNSIIFCSQGYLCARKVSTILCVHDKMCTPSDCNGHGDCSSAGQCVCHAPWSGPACSQQEMPNVDIKACNVCMYQVKTLWTIIIINACGPIFRCLSELCLHG